MAKTASPSGRIMYTPKQSFVAEFEGVPQVFQPLRDRFDEDHPLVLRNPGLFEVVTVNREWEAATAAPGERRA